MPAVFQYQSENHRRLRGRGMLRFFRFNMWGTHRLRSVFEEGVLAHQAVRRWLSVADSDLF
jgi:hypothetical protein